MSTAETACYSTPEEFGLRVESVPFDQVPSQSRLFLDYLKDPTALREFYPTAVKFHHELPARADLPADKGRLAGANAVLRDEFNCRSRWSDATAAQCSELEFLKAGGSAKCLTLRLDGEEAAAWKRA